MDNIFGELEITYFRVMLCNIYFTIYGLFQNAGFDPDYSESVEHKLYVLL